MCRSCSRPVRRLFTEPRMLECQMQFGSREKLSGAGSPVLASTNISLPTRNWSMIGPATETPPGSGLFEFTDPDATNPPHRFYGVKLP